MYLDTTRSPPVLYLVDYTGNAISVIQLSGTGTQLAAARVRTIVGADTGLANPLGIAVIH